MSEPLRFGEFELDAAGFELRRDGRAVRLERLPMELLLLLVERRGQLVGRQEIVDKLWGREVFVDAETSVNTAVRKVRQALRDDPDAPTYVQTVTGKGYRFVAEVTADAAAASPLSEPLPVPVPVPQPAPAPAPSAAPPPRRRTIPWSLAGLALTVLLAFGGWALWSARQPPTHAALVVLPFDNLTGNADDEYLADSLTEETIAVLGRMEPERLSVIARTSSMAYKGARKDVASIGRELGVDYVLESSVRRDGSRIRITSALIRVRGQSQLWSASWDREAGSFLGVQDEMGRAIAEQVRVRVSPAAPAQARSRTQDPEAYDLYLRGRYFLNNERTPAALALARHHFEAAIAEDSSFAPAFAGLSDTLATMVLVADVAPTDVWRPAQSAAERAVELAPGLAEAHASLGLIKHRFAWDWPAAERSLRHAVKLNPNYADAYVLLAFHLSAKGRHDEAIEAIERARRLDPVSPHVGAMKGLVLFQARRYGAARSAFDEAIAAFPEFWISYQMRAGVLERLGDASGALEPAQRAVELSGANAITVAVRGYVLARAGREEEARAVARDLESRAKYVPPYPVALVHAGLGDRDGVFAWLEKSLAARDPRLTQLMVDSRWDPFRSDPRYADLLRRCGFDRSQ